MIYWQRKKPSNSFENSGYFTFKPAVKMSWEFFEIDESVSGLLLYSFVTWGAWLVLDNKMWILLILPIAMACLPAYTVITFMPLLIYWGLPRTTYALSTKGAFVVQDFWLWQRIRKLESELYSIPIRRKKDLYYFDLGSQYEWWMMPYLRYGKAGAVAQFNFYNVRKEDYAQLIYLFREFGIQYHLIED